MFRTKNLGTLACVLLLLSTSASHAQTRWVGSWSTAQQLPEPQNSLASEELGEATLRQVVHLSIGGTELRVHLSNRFGASPLHLASVHIARPTRAGAIDASTDKPLTFAGRTDVVIPAGAEYLSDSTAFSVPALSDLAITIYFDVSPAGQTGHPGSRATSYLARGNSVSAAELPNPKKVEHWYFISAVDVAAASQAAVAVVALGDSITDGHGATTDGNNRWPDLLAKRLQGDPATQMVAVLNEGIGGNRLLLDGLGPNALARFDEDALTPAGVRFVIVLEGVNDIGMLSHNGEVPASDHQELAQRIIAAYEQMIARGHAHGLEVIGATILPFVGSEFYHPGPTTEADRQTINQWIRSPGHFDAVIDFDKVTRDPEHPERLLPAFDSGDHLHPSPAGYAAMAEAIPLSLFTSGQR
jgi:lysophospholipase L1-like esterase